MKNEKAMDELIKNWSEESLGKNMDRRNFIQGASKLAGLSLGLALAQSMGGIEVNAPQNSAIIHLLLVYHLVIHSQIVLFYGQGWLQIR